jgi:hypothetical protein
VCVCIMCVLLFLVLLLFLNTENYSVACERSEETF